MYIFFDENLGRRRHKRKLLVQIDFNPLKLFDGVLLVDKTIRIKSTPLSYIRSHVLLTTLQQIKVAFHDRHTLLRPEQM